MNKLLVVGVAIAGVAIAAKRFAPRLPRGGFRQGASPPCPTAPHPSGSSTTSPRSARNSSDRILEILEARTATIVGEPSDQP